MAIPQTQSTGTKSFTTTEIITVGDALGLAEKKGALTVPEMFSALSGASANSLIMSSAAAAMVTPLTVVLAIYSVFQIIQIAINILKPIVKMILNIGGMFTNPAEIGELLADVVMTIMQFLIGLAPMLIAMLITLFLSIPIGVKFITKEIMANAQAAIVDAKTDLANKTNLAINAVTAAGSANDANNAFTNAYKKATGKTPSSSNTLPDPGIDGMAITNDNGQTFVYDANAGQWDLVNGDWLAAYEELSGANPDYVVNTPEDVQNACIDGIYAEDGGNFYISNSCSWDSLTVTSYDTRDDFPEDATEGDLGEENGNLYIFEDNEWTALDTISGRPTMVSAGTTIKVKSTGKLYVANDEDFDIEPLDPKPANGKENANDFSNLSNQINDLLTSLIGESDAYIDSLACSYFLNGFDFADAFKTEVRNFKNKLLRYARELYDNTNVDPRNIENWDEMTDDQRNELATVLDGLLTAAKKIEGLTLEGILDKHFFAEDGYRRPLDDDEAEAKVCNVLFDTYANAVSDEIQDCVCAKISEIKELIKAGETDLPKVNVNNCFFTIVTNELRKKQKQATQVAQDINALGIAQDIISNNKSLLMDLLKTSVINKKPTSSCHVTGSNFLDLDAQSDLISTLQSNLKTTISNANSTINSASVTNTTEMETLVSDIQTQINNEIDAYTIVFNTALKEDLDASMVTVKRKFESCIVGETKRAMKTVEFDITINDIPTSANIANVRKEIREILDGFVDKLMEEVEKIVVDKTIECKAAKSAEQLITDIENYKDDQTTVILNALKNNINNITGNWSVIDGNDTAPKNLLKMKVYDALNTYPIYDMKTYLSFVLKLEQNELYDNISKALTPVVL